MINKNPFLKSYLFIQLALGVLMLACLFFPFRIEVTLSGQSISFFGSGSFVLGGVRTFKSGWHFAPVIIPFAAYFITLLFSVFSKRKVGKIFTLISVVVQLLSLLFLYVAVCFTLNLFGPGIEASPGFGFYLFAFFSLFFLVITVINVIKTWKNTQVKSNFYESDLLDS